MIQQSSIYQEEHLFNSRKVSDSVVLVTLFERSVRENTNISSELGRNDLKTF